MTKSIFLKRLSATVQFILGFVLGVALIAGISGTAIFAYYKKMSIVPQKPDYPEIEAKEDSNAQPAITEAESATDIEPLESNTTDVPAETPPEPEPEEPPEEVELPPNAYRAQVTWPEGLSLRAEPEIEADRVGGIEAEATIFVLEDSADGAWQRVQLPWNGQEGWVKGGNTERISN